MKKFTIAVAVVFMLVVAFVPFQSTSAHSGHEVCVNGTFYLWVPDAKEWDGGHWAVVWQVGNYVRNGHMNWYTKFPNAHLWSQPNPNTVILFGGVSPWQKLTRPASDWRVCSNS